MLVFLILHFGDCKTTCDCIDSILNMGYVSEHVILVADNDSEPKDWDLYKDNSRIRFVKTYNKGFSEANNIAYGYARSTLGADMVVVCNNDLLFSKEDFDEETLLELNRKDIQAAGPDIIKKGTDIHQSPIDTRLRTVKEAKKTIRINKLMLALYPLAYPAARKFFNGRTQTGVEVSSDDTTVVPFGACLIFTERFIDKEEKLFEPETRFYYEEYILAKRFQDKGYKIAYEPKLKVTHIDAAASSAGSDYQKIRRKIKNTTQACEVYLKLIEGDAHGG